MKEFVCMYVLSCVAKRRKKESNDDEEEREEDEEEVTYFRVCMYVRTYGMYVQLIYSCFKAPLFFMGARFGLQSFSSICS